MGKMDRDRGAPGGRVWLLKWLLLAALLAMVIALMLLGSPGLPPA